uniref:Uncharacterized protein n=1 Tax=Hyaloperonospora arabidopsidis (strain Emoy2) TaxID=559515 RepID=M4BWW1_HYAAE
MTVELVKRIPRIFVAEVLDPRWPHIAKFWSAEQFEVIESDHLLMCRESIVNERVKTKFYQHDHEKMFNIGWDDVQGCILDGLFRCLRQFCCGLATVFANKKLVESDFSMLKWEKDDRRTYLSCLALEREFQTRNFDLLTRL